MRLATTLTALTLATVAQAQTLNLPQQLEQYRNIAELSVEQVKGLSQMSALTLQEGKKKSQLIPLAKQALTSNLRDPDSVKFRNVRLVKYGEGYIVCGALNAKNGYGAYVGYRAFAASPILTMVRQSTDPLELARTYGIVDACGALDF